VLFPYGPGRRVGDTPQSYVECCRSKRPCNGYPVICCASAVAGNDRTRWSYVSAARTPFPRRRQAAGRDRLPWLWYRCGTVGQQVRISILAGQSRFARPAGFEPATGCLEGSCSVRLSYGRSEIIVAGEYHASATCRSQCVAPPTAADSQVYEQSVGRYHFAGLSCIAGRGRTGAPVGRWPYHAGRCRSLPRYSGETGFRSKQSARLS
jgi:hypothetical protein